MDVEIHIENELEILNSFGDIGFESLLTKLEMGSAYKSITEKMGPSIQLTAFVNYDLSLNTGLGLESLTLDDDHRQILEDIDKFSQFATESFSSKLKDSFTAVNEVITLWKKRKSFDFYKTAKLVRRESESFVLTPKCASEILEIQVKFIDELKIMIAKLPRLTNKDERAVFAELSDNANFITELTPKTQTLVDQYETVLKNNPQVAFSKSGWTEQTFKQAIHKFETLHASASQQLLISQPIIKKMVLVAAGTSILLPLVGAVALTSARIGTRFGRAWGVFLRTRQKVSLLDYKSYSILRDVSDHFEEAK